MVNRYKTLFYGFLLSVLLQQTNHCFATTYYSRASGNWNDNNSWSTVGYGNATNSGTYPKSADIAYIGDGYTLTINTTLTVGTVSIGQGSSGIVEYGETSAFTFAVVNSLTINSGGKFWYNGNSSRSHVLQIGTSLTNNGTFDLYADADDLVNLTFNRSTSGAVSGSGTWALNNVTVSKSSSSVYYVDVQASGFEAAIHDLSITLGTYIHNNSSTYSVNSYGSSAFTVGQDVVVKVNQGTLWLSQNADDVILNGSIVVNGGTLKCGSTAGNTGIRYDKTGTAIPKIDLQSGAIEVFGGISYKSGASADPMQFTMSGGTLTLNSGSTGTAAGLLQINDVSASIFSMSEGTILFQQPNTTGTSVSDFTLCTSSGTVTAIGGITQFGNELTTDGAIFNFSPASGVGFPSIKVMSDGFNSVTLQPSNGNTANISVMSLWVDYGCTFDIRSCSGSSGDSRTLTLTGNIDGINSLYVDGTFNGRSSVLNLQGGEGQQLDGTGIIDVYDLTMDNVNGASLGTNISINGTLTLTNGLLYTSSTAVLTLNAGAVCDVGSASSYVEGPMIRKVAASGTTTLDFPIGKGGASAYYRPVTLQVSHSSASTASYQVEVMSGSARDLNYDMPVGVEKVSAQRFLNVSRTGASNLTSAVITLVYGSDDGVTDHGSLTLVTDDGAGNWVDIGGAGTADVSGSITSDAFSSVGSYLSLANKLGGGNPLPVKLLSFDVSRKEQVVCLTWTTASESNSAFFGVEKSSDGMSFETVGTVTAAGTATTLKRYRFADPNCDAGNWYYRLKMADKDGRTEYSTVRVVKIEASRTLAVFPNPVTRKDVTLHLPVTYETSCRVSFYGQDGRLNGCFNGIADVSGHLTIDQLSLVPGNYVVTVSTPDGSNWNEQIVFAGDQP